MIALAEPDPEWPAKAERLITELGAVLGPILVRCHHIGSTAVPGLVAKPVIDLLPEVTDLGALESRREALDAAGFEWLGAYGLPRRRYLRRDREGVREVQVHAYATGDPEVARHLAFRDHLRRNADDRALYARTKADCAARCADIGAYGDCKDAVVKAIEARALTGTP